MTRRYTGGLISATAQATDANSANGIFTLADAQERTARGDFPVGRWTPQRSLRFRAAASAYLNRTFGAPTNNKKWTYSTWFKRGQLTYGASGAAGALFFAPSSGSTFAGIYFTPTDIINWYDASGGATVYLLQTTQVFRDPSAWYHLVCTYDSAQATAANRQKMYVNGVQITAFGTASYVAQNTDGRFNSAVAHDLGRLSAAGPYYFDGQITETNFIDGQALDPSYFGSTDAETGTWVPKRYAGTYGTNGFYLPFRDNTSATTLGYDFSAGTYSQNLRSLGTNIGTLTLNGGLASAFDGNTNQANAASARVSSPAAGYNTAVIGKDWGVGVSKTITAVRLFSQNDGGFVGGTTNALTFKLQGSNDNSSWTDLTSAITGPATGAGTVITVTSGITTTAAYRYHRINMNANGADNYYMCELEFYEAGIYGFNNWTANSFSVTAGVTYDSMVDVPGIASVSSQLDVGGVQRGNYATWNPLDKHSSITMAEGNLKVQLYALANGSCGYRGTVGVSSGKWYWEVLVGANQASRAIGNIGIDTLNTSISSINTVGTGVISTSYVYYQANGNKLNNNVSTAYGATYATNDVIGVAFDADNGTLTFYKNGVSQGQAFSGISGTFAPSGSLYSDTVNGSYIADMYYNFGQRPFTYTPPTGFKSLNTTNFANPVIKRPSDHFDVKTYVGNGTALTVGTIAKQTSAVQINKSLLFKSAANTYLSRTPASASNRKTWTWSGWVKRGTLITTGGGEYLFSTSGTIDALRFDTDHTLQFSLNSGNSGNIKTNAKFNNTSIWYHIVIICNTTAASNRLQMFVNGVNQSFSANTQPSLNYDTALNNTNSHQIGRLSTGSTYFDGYIAEVNFIDGQALTPASFGQFDANNNWVPQRYTGTYGTNGFKLDFNDSRSPTTAANDVSGNSNHWTPFTYGWNTVPSANTAPNVLYYGTPGTYSWTAPAGVTSVNYLVVAGGGWGNGSGGGGGAGGMLTGTLSVTPSTSYTVTVGNGSTAVNTNGLNSIFSSITSTGGGYGASNSIVGGNGGSGGGGSRDRQSNGVTNWNSAAGTGTAGQGNNGGAVNAVTPPPSSNQAVGGGGGGAGAAGGAGAVDGITGGAGGAGLTSSITGVSIYYAGGGGGIGAGTSGGAGGAGGLGGGGGGTGPGGGIASAGENGLGGGGGSNYGGGSGVVILSYTNAASYVGNGAGSSNNNNSLFNSPTDTVDSSGNTIGNYAVLNGNDLGYSAVVSEGNLKVSTASASNAAVSSNFSLTTDTYWEVTVGSNIQVGLIWGRASAAYEGSSLSVFASGATGSLNNATRTLSATPSWANGDTLGFAWNNSARTLTLYQAGSATAVMIMGTPSVGDPQVAITNYTSGAVMSAQVNFGQSGFVYAPPAGYKTLNTKHLKDVGSYNLPDTFGNFVNTPDLVWIKNRTSANNHILQDTVRGTGTYLDTTTAAQQSLTNGIQAFIPNGFEIGTISGANTLGNNIVAWNWNRGRVPGFDIVTWRSSGATMTVPHNLGVAPSWIVNKSMSTTSGWNSYHSAIGATGSINMQTTAVTSTAADWWNNTSPSSSEFTVSLNFPSGYTWVSYLWAEVPGFSRFGRYTGNASTDGPFVYCGFSPKYIMWKRTDAVGDWIVQDTSRALFNPRDNTLYPNLSAVEGVSGGYPIDILSNGFKVRNTAAYANASGGNYIFMAFADAPFKYANAR